MAKMNRSSDQLDRIRRFDEKFRFGTKTKRLMKVLIPLAVMAGIAGGLLMCQYVDKFQPFIQLWIFAPIVFAIAAGGITFGIFYFFFNHGAQTPKKK